MYTDPSVLELMTDQSKGNYWYMLYSQYIAAFLNSQTAWVPDDVDDSLNEAAVLLTEVNKDALAAKGKNKDKTLHKDFVEVSGILASYNEGDTGPGHCGEASLSLTGEWLLSVNDGAYQHDMTLTEGLGGVLSGSGGYPAGGEPYSFPFNWTLTGLLVGDAVEMTISYENSYTAELTGVVDPAFDFMSGGAGTGGVVNWSAALIIP